MNFAHRWPAALLALAACGPLALAQPAQPGSTSGGGPGAGPIRAADADGPEDVEIMRRLLERALGEAYGLAPAKPGVIRTYGSSATPGYYAYAAKNVAGEETHPSPLVEGVHLKDFGVLYTATLPYPGFDPVSGSKPQAAGKPPLDPWERTRKEIHGETPAPEGKPLPAHQPLSEVILKVLADNGRHFTGLADGERVAVAVTFRGAATCANCHQNPWGNNGQPLATFQATTYFQEAGQPADPNQTPAPGSTAPDGGTYSGPPPVPATPEPAWQNNVRSDVLLGDLHLKQGKPSEAVAAYQKALNDLEQGIDRKRYQQAGYIPADLPALLTSVDLCTKLASAYAASGKDEEARKMLQNAARLAKEAEALTGGAQTTKVAGPAALPGKLVVTASKKLLDEVGSGKMTFEAFCKAATAEYTPAAGGAVQPAANDPGTGGK